MIRNWSESITWAAMSRKKIDEDGEGKGQLARVMGIFDLTALGVGSTLGLGVYVLAGSVAKESAGPAVCISFLIAAIASAFAGMCYAEFASRVPKAGSAYVYSYVTVGEFIAFVIGWNLILEYVIGTASMARGLSTYLDNLIDNAMSKALREAMPMDVSFLSEYPDFFAFCMVFLLTSLLCVGVRESSILNNIFTTINLLTIATIVIVGSFIADPANWFINPKKVPSRFEHVGEGGFLPFGVRGVLTGAATCFYGFVGFDAVATTGEEAKNPQRNIPLAIVISLAIIFAAYFSISTVLTMMWPYYDQNVNAPFPYVFQQLGWPTIRLIVNIGAIFALCTSLLGAMFPLPRILYAMGSDGVIFRALSKIHPRTRTPVFGTVIAGCLTAVMTLIFNLKQLIDMMSIGTLLAYTIVAVSVLILRYQGPVVSDKKPASNSVHENFSFTPVHIFSRIFNLNNFKEPSAFSSSVAKWGVLFYSIMVLIFGVILNQVSMPGSSPNFWSSNLLAVTGLILILAIAALSRQPAQEVQLSFKVPLVPVIPCCSIFINVYLMLQLDAFTWIRFTLWMIVGFAIYFTYGVTHSSQRGNQDKDNSENELKVETKL